MRSIAARNSAFGSITPSAIICSAILCIRVGSKFKGFSSGVGISSSKCPGLSEPRSSPVPPLRASEGTVSTWRLFLVLFRYILQHLLELRLAPDLPPLVQVFRFRRQHLFLPLALFLLLLVLQLLPLGRRGFRGTRLFRCVV